MTAVDALQTIARRARRLFGDMVIASGVEITTELRSGIVVETCAVYVTIGVSGGAEVYDRIIVELEPGESIDSDVLARLDGRLALFKLECEEEVSRWGTDGTSDGPDLRLVS